MTDDRFIVKHWLIRIMKAEKSQEDQQAGDPGEQIE